MGNVRPWKHQGQPTRPFKAWTPNCYITVRASKVMAEVDAQNGAKETKTYGFAWDEDDGELLTCYQDGKELPAEEATEVLQTMADDITASPLNRRAAKRILKAINTR